MNASRQLLLTFPIGDDHTFNTFVAGSNRELVDRMQNIQVQQDQFFFIWGAIGSGRSHLLQAVCQGNERYVYLPLKRYARAAPEILDSLGHYSLVCLDDIEVVLGSPAWEEKLFTLFNNIIDGQRRLVVSADIAPRGLATELPDLASRLGWGITYQLHELNDADKAEALRLRAAQRGFRLSEEVLGYILLRNERQMQSLFKVFEKMDHLSLQEKRRITVPFVKQIMQW